MLSTFCTKLWIFKENLKEDARGVSAVEYAILLAIIVAVLAFFAGDLKELIEGIFTKVEEQVDETMGSVSGEGGNL